MSCENILAEKRKRCTKEVRVTTYEVEIVRFVRKFGVEVIFVAKFVFFIFMFMLVKS